MLDTVALYSVNVTTCIHVYILYSTGSNRTTSTVGFKSLTKSVVRSFKPPHTHTILLSIKLSILKIVNFIDS